MSSTTNSAEFLASENPETTSDVLVQYVVLRRDLIDTWPLVSVVKQGCHASVAAIWSHKEDPHTIDYCSPTNLDSMHKVTLEVKGEVQLKNLSEKLKSNDIAHKLWIEQRENTPTCLASKPYPKSVVSVFFKELKLLPEVAEESQDSASSSNPASVKGIGRKPSGTSSCSSYFEGQSPAPQRTQTILLDDILNDPAKRKKLEDVIQSISAEINSGGNNKGNNNKDGNNEATK